MKTNLQRATAADIEDGLLKGWTLPSSPPPDDRVVLIVRASPIGRNLLLRDYGYYEEGEWLTVRGDPLHPVKAWHPYPDLPNWEEL